MEWNVNGVTSSSSVSSSTSTLFEISPPSSTGPVIPGQTSSLGGGGRGTWGRPGGTTPGPRNQELSPVIPNQALAGGGAGGGGAEH